MKRAEQISAIFWLLIGIFVSYGSYNLGLGKGANPGPGFIPFWCGVILSGFALFLLFKSVINKKNAAGENLIQLWTGRGWQKAVWVVSALIGYGLAFPALGFLLSTIIFLFFLLKVIEPTKSSVALTVAIMASFISHFIFSRWAGVAFPQGIIEKIFF